MQIVGTEGNNVNLQAAESEFLLGASTHAGHHCRGARCTISFRKILEPSPLRQCKLHDDRRSKLNRGAEPWQPWQPWKEYSGTIAIAPVPLAIGIFAVETVASSQARKRISRLLQLFVMKLGNGVVNRINFPSILERVNR
jgi:hypothetical protein